MRSIDKERIVWNNLYHWREQGEEWSASWGGSDMQWYATILPRIHMFVPAETILEIGPGFGRWTQFLKELCERLIVVDLAGKCIEACKARFSDDSHISYYVNDGESLEMIADYSIDFAFSFDSLVHTEDTVIRAYLSQLARKLKKDGVGFIHHSNIGEYRKYFSLIRKLPRGRSLLTKKLKLLEKDHSRAYSMTAGKFERYADEAGLRCISQEMVPCGKTKRLIDCMSTFTGTDSVWARPNRVIRNRDFMKMADYYSELSKLYGKKYLGVNTLMI